MTRILIKTETNRRIRYKTKNILKNYSAVDKVGNENLFSQEILFRVELIVSLFFFYFRSSYTYKFFKSILFLSVCVPKGLGKLWSKAFLAKMVETRDKNRGVRRKRCRAFPERVSPRILSLLSVDYFGFTKLLIGRFSAMIEMTRYVHHAFLLFGNDVISLESSPLIFMFLHTRA